MFRCENVFLVSCLLWGLIFLIVNPPFQAPDEPAHFFKMWGYTQGTLRHTIKAGWSGTELPESIERIYKFYSQYVYTNKKIPLIETVKYSKLPLNKDNKVFVKFIPTSYTPLSYFPSFIVLWVMKFLSIKPLLMMYILRFCSLLVYLSLTYFAIKITPCKKWLFLFFSLLPVNVYQAAAISTDGITLGVIMLFAAYTLKLAFDDSIVKIEKQQIIIWDVLITCIGLLKFTYFPLILLYFLIPKNKFASIKQYFTNFGIVLILNMFLIACVIAVTMSAKGINEYTYGKNLMSGFEVIKKILQSPLDYIVLVYQSTLFLRQFIFRNIISSVGGNLIMIPNFASNLTWFLLFLSCFYKSKAEDLIDLKIKNKMLILTILIFCYCLIITSVYLVYQRTEPYIIGIQGRYLTPLLLFFMLLFNLKNICVKNKIVPAILTFAAQFLLLMTFVIIIVYYY